MLREKNPDAAILTTLGRAGRKTILSAIEKVSLTTSCSRRCASTSSRSRHEHEHHHDHDEHDDTTMSTSIITTTTRMMTTTSMSIITSMTTTTTSTITITRRRDATIPRASAITIITTPTACSPPGARKRPSSTPRQRLTTSSRSSTAATTVTFCAPRHRERRGGWLEFDYVPESTSPRGPSDYTAACASSARSSRKTSSPSFSVCKEGHSWIFCLSGRRFLDAGKTNFINGILEDGFAREDKTLLLCCEEGEEEYEKKALDNVTVVTVDDETS